MWTDGYVVFDTETTGLTSDARIVEVACVTFEKGEVVHSWSTLIRPDNVDWDNKEVRKALEVNRIELADLQDKPSFAEILPDLLTELAHPVWVAHNLTFDIRMLDQELKRLKREPLTPPLSICTLNLASKLNQSTAGNRLFDVAARYCVRVDSSHRAAVDATVCGHILRAMIEEGRLPPEDDLMREFCSRAAAQRRSRSW